MGSNFKVPLKGKFLNPFAPGRQSGYFITINDDTNKLGMDDPGSRNGVAGQIHVYKYNDEAARNVTENLVWEQLGPSKEGEAPEDQFGFAIALSGNGGKCTKFAAGAPFNRDTGVELVCICIRQEKFMVIKRLKEVNGNSTPQ